MFLRSISLELFTSQLLWVSSYVSSVCGARMFSSVQCESILKITYNPVLLFVYIYDICNIQYLINFFIAYMA
jgi:hypothetical protein